MTPILMPQVGENLTTGSIVEWLKSERDTVVRGEIILTVESEKAVFEVEAEVDGILARIVYRAGDEAEVLQPVGYIGQPGEALDAEAPAPEASAAPMRTAEQEPPFPGSPPAALTPRSRGRPRALGDGTDPASPSVSAQVQAPSSVSVRRPSSPSARRLARELGLDLARVEGSGPGGRIIRADVLSADAAPGLEMPAEASGRARRHRGEGRVEELTGLRRHVAARATLSHETIPHFYLFADVDMSASLARRERLNHESSIKLTVTDLIVQATAHALRRFGRLNAHMQGNGIAIKRAINIGLATAVDGGMVIPVIVDADEKSLPQLAVARGDLVEAVRRGRIGLGPASGFTITNLGMHGVARVQPLINPPECAILGVGTVEERVVSRDRTMAVGDVMSLCLGCDHRAVDGVHAAQFLTCLKGLLEHPESLPGDPTR